MTLQIKIPKYHWYFHVNNHGRTSPDHGYYTIYIYIFFLGPETQMWMVVTQQRWRRWRWQWEKQI